MLLANTILADGFSIRLVHGVERTRAAIGGPSGVGDAVAINDGGYLKVSYSLFLDEAHADGPMLKVEKSSFQYQRDRAGKDWVFRYDYIRDHPGNPHPRSHLQLRGSLAADVRLPRQELKHIHFPVGRPTLEGVIRCLADQFGVAQNTAADWWRPMLAESETAFLQVASIPISGPDRA